MDVTSSRHRKRDSSWRGAAAPRRKRLHHGARRRVRLQPDLRWEAGKDAETVAHGGTETDYATEAPRHRGPKSETEASDGHFSRIAQRVGRRPAAGVRDRVEHRSQARWGI